MSFWNDRAPLDRFRVVLLIAVATFTAAVAALAFWVSFEAISVYAVRIGAFPKHLGWAAPLLVDSFTLLGTAFLLWLALSGQKLRKMFDHWYAWALIVVATAGSAYLNYEHVVGEKFPEARWVAGAVPVVLLAAVHLLVLLLLRVLELGKPAPVNPPAGVGERREGEAHAPGGTDRSSERARVVREHLKEHPGESANAVKKMLQSHPAGVGNTTRLYELVAQVKAESNGSASKVEVGT